MCQVTHSSIPLQASAASKRETLCPIHRSFIAMSGRENERSTTRHVPGPYTTPPPPSPL